MYNIWCEVKKMNILLVVLGACIFVGEILINERIDYVSLVLTILLILLLIRDIFKYLNLKKKGTLLENVPYILENISGGEKVLLIDYTFPNGEVRRFFKKSRALNKKSINGTTKILVDMENPKNYYIFMPE